MSLLVDNRELLDRYRNGEAEALTAVYREYVDRVAAYLHQGFSVRIDGRSVRFLGYDGAFELQDAVQEAFVRAFSERARVAYDGLRPFGNYLLTIARNLVIDELRSASHKLGRFAVDEQALTEEGTPLVSPLPSPERQAQRVELRRLLQSFIASLSAAERAVLEARFQRGLSQRDAAAAVGTTRMKLRTIERRIRRRAVDHFGRSGYLAALIRDRGVGVLLAAIPGGCA